MIIALLTNKVFNQLRDFWREEDVCRSDWNWLLPIDDKWNLRITNSLCTQSDTIRSTNYFSRTIWL